jgi:pimeloyl-ACP methyl ester carboxylesterase
MSDLDIKARDGRRLGVHVVTQGSTGRTVVMCHAAPGSGAFDPEPEETWRRGVTLLAVDRPGYGGSDPVSGDRWATVDSAALDIADVLEARDAGPVGVVGWSAGGRVALALAALRPDLVDRVVVLATPAPDEEVQWVPPEQRASLEQLRGLPAAEVHRLLGEQLAPLVPADPADAVGLLASANADSAVLAREGVRTRVAGMLEVGFTQGAAGLAADIAGYCLRPWGFTPDQVAAKALLLYGAADQLAGPKHGKWYQARLPDSRFEQVPGEGHLLVVPMWKRALSHLSPNQRR